MSADDGLPFAMQSLSRQEFSAPLSSADTERLLDGHGPHGEAPAVQHAIAGLLGSAAGPASDRELAGEVTAAAAFAWAVGERAARPARSRVRARRGPAVVAGIAAAIVVAFSGAAAANALPVPVQHLAHTAFGAPAPRHPAPRHPAPRHPAPRHPAPLPEPTRPAGTPDTRGQSRKPARQREGHREERAAQGAGARQGEGESRTARPSRRLSPRPPVRRGAGRGRWLWPRVPGSP